MEISGPVMQKMTAYWQAVKKGEVGVYPKDGKFYIDTGEPGKPIEVPRMLLPGLKDDKGAAGRPRAAIQPPNP
jgi:hypothetical protein